MLIGARMAGGCTSGHVISGGMQIAVSSLVFFSLIIQKPSIVKNITVRVKDIQDE